MCKTSYIKSLDVDKTVSKTCIVCIVCSSLQFSSCLCICAHCKHRSLSSAAPGQAARASFARPSETRVFARSRRSKIALVLSLFGVSSAASCSQPDLGEGSDFLDRVRVL